MVQKIKEMTAKQKAGFVGTVGTAIMFCTPALAFADDPTVTGTLTTGVTNAVTQAQDAIMAVLPQALVLMGVILGITVGIRLFKRFAK